MTSSTSRPRDVQAAEQREALPHGEEVLQRGLLEQNSGFLAKAQVRAARRDSAPRRRSAARMPSMISIVVVLPAPFGPSRPKQMPFGHGE